jgi:hypothetical protein
MVGQAVSHSRVIAEVGAGGMDTNASLLLQEVQDVTRNLARAQSATARLFRFDMP